MYRPKYKPIATKASPLRRAALFIALFATPACTAPQQPSAPNIADTPTIQRFEAPNTWQIKNCKIQATVGRVTLITDGTLSHNTMRYAVQLPEHAQEFLQASLLGIGGVSLNVNGRKDRWSLELPNTPHAAAQMLKNQVYLLLTYKPVPTTHTPAPLEKTVVFPLKNLPEILAKHEALCL